MHRLAHMVATAAAKKAVGAAKDRYTATDADGSVRSDPDRLKADLVVGLQAAERVVGRLISDLGGQPQRPVLPAQSHMTVVVEDRDSEPTPA